MSILKVNIWLRPAHVNSQCLLARLVPAAVVRSPMASSDNEAAMLQSAAFLRADIHQREPNGSIGPDEWALAVGISGGVARRRVEHLTARPSAWSDNDSSLVIHGMKTFLPVTQIPHRHGSFRIRLLSHHATESL